MRTWLKIDNLNTKEDMFLRELYLSNNLENKDIYNAMINYSKYSPLNSICNKSRNLLTHTTKDKYIKFYTNRGNAEINLRDYKNSSRTREGEMLTNPRAVYSADNIKDLKEGYFRILRFNGEIDIFSFGTYRLYKKQWYKLMEKLEWK